MTLQDYLSYFDTFIPPTEKLFRLVPADKLDWKPTESSFTCGQLMTHIGGAIGAYGNGISKGEWRFPTLAAVHELNKQTPSLGIEQAVGLLHTKYEFFKSSLCALTEDEFNNGMVDTPQLGRVPRWRIALFGMEHHLNHKAELFMYLKMLGLNVRTEDLYLMR